MAKTTKGTDLVTTGGGLVLAQTRPVEIAVNGDFGKSNDAEDNLVPLIQIVQSNSKVAKKGLPEYIPGAAEGDFYLKAANNPIVSGDDGFLFQPCAFWKDWGCWGYPRNPNVADFRGRFPHKGIVKEGEDNPHGLPTYTIVKDGKGREHLVRSDTEKPDSEFIETRNHAGFVFFADGTVSPYIMPLVSSGHTVSKEWMRKMNNQNNVPSVQQVFRITTKTRQNAEGTWSVPNPQFMGFLDPKSSPEVAAQVELGVKLGEAFMAGELGAEDDGDAV